MEPWSPARLGGLREADRVLEVNEDFVDKMDIGRVGVQDSLSSSEDVGDRFLSLYLQVVRKIRSCGLNLFMLVLTREDYQQVRLPHLRTLARGSSG